MKLELFLDETIEQNAAHPYEKAKRAKQKHQGGLKAIHETEAKLRTLLNEKDQAIQKLQQSAALSAAKRKKEWYEKFHWFRSSTGFLCIGGRDSTTNEIVVKKHAEKDDLILHTDMAGSPFFVIKNGQHADDQTINEAAQATASYSKAWKAGLTTLGVFYVNPDHVSKKAQSGEYMPKGAFMIYGQTKYVHPIVEIAIGRNNNNQILGGPVDAIKAQAEKYVILVPGREKSSDIAKKIKKLLSATDIDEIISFIPAGGSALSKPTG